MDPSDVNLVALTLTATPKAAEMNAHRMIGSGRIENRYNTDKSKRKNLTLSPHWPYPLCYRVAEKKNSLQCIGIRPLLWSILHLHVDIVITPLSSSALRLLFSSFFMLPITTDGTPWSF